MSETKESASERAQAWLSEVAYGAPWAKVGEDGDYQVVDRIGKQVADCADRDIAVGIAAAPDLVRELAAELAKRTAERDALAEGVRLYAELLDPDTKDPDLLGSIAAWRAEHGHLVKGEANATTDNL